MAYVEEQDPKKQLVPGAPSSTNQGSTLAGSGGTAPSGASSPQASSTPGTGFTNLEGYLGTSQSQRDAGQGTAQGAKVAGEINAAGSGYIKPQTDIASAAATKYEADGVTAANAGAAKGIADAQSGFSGTTAYSGPESASKDDGPNGLEEAYKNVNNKVDAFSAEPMFGQSALQKNHGYGSGFAALDNFIGRQDGRPEIQKWEKNSKSGNAQSSYDKGNEAIATAKGNLKTEQDKWLKSQKQQQQENPYTPPDPTNPTALPPAESNVWTETEKGPTVFSDATSNTPPATPPPTNTGGGQLGIDPDLMNAPPPTTTPVGRTIYVDAPEGTVPATPPPQSGGGQLAIDPNLMFPEATPTPKAVGLGGEGGIDTGETPEQRAERTAAYQAEKTAKLEAEKQATYEREALAITERNAAYTASHPESYITQKIDELQNWIIRNGFTPMTPQQIEDFRVSEGYSAKPL